MADQNREVTGWVGWIAFASFMLMFNGALQIAYGIAALLNQSWYVATNSSVFLFNIATWGWISIILGGLLLATGIMLQNGRIAGRTLGLIFVVIGAAYSLALIAVAPMWSILALVVYALVGYAIIAHGSEMKELKHA
jgi:hypothetical protein